MVNNQGNIKMKHYATIRHNMIICDFYHLIELIEFILVQVFIICKYRMINIQYV
jgi:hypothetical protein